MYTDASGPAENPDYRQRRDYHLADEIPVYIAGHEVGRIPVQTLFPSGD